MKKEKLAAIGLVVIIVGALSAFLLVEYKDEILDSVKWDSNKSAGGVIQLGDCADIDFTAYFENGTVFATSYKDVAIEWDLYNSTLEDQYVPINVFVKFELEYPPEGYENYTIFPIRGFMEGLIGLKEGVKTKIGPVPPEKGFGVQLQKGDIVNVSLDPELGFPVMNVQFIDIVKNVSKASISEEFQYYALETNNTVYVGKDLSKKVGDVKTLYPSWENATVATKTNDTTIWWETIPSENKMNNFTWIEDTGYGYISYWENASSAVIDKDNNTIFITHNPTKGQKFNVSNFLEYTVENINATKINCSYTLYDGNTSYYHFDRVINTTLNFTENLITEYPESFLSLLFTYYRLLDTNVIYGLGPYTNQTLYFDVHVIKVYKTS